VSRFVRSSQRALRGLRLLDGAALARLASTRARFAEFLARPMEPIALPLLAYARHHNSLGLPGGKAPWESGAAGASAASGASGALGVSASAAASGALADAEAALRADATVRDELTLRLSEASGAAWDAVDSREEEARALVASVERDGWRLAAAEAAASLFATLLAAEAERFVAARTLLLD
jgi:hypothetical protein